MKPNPKQGSLGRRFSGSASPASHSRPERPVHVPLHPDASLRGALASRDGGAILPQTERCVPSFTGWAHAPRMR